MATLPPAGTVIRVQVQPSVNNLLVLSRHLIGKQLFYRFLWWLSVLMVLCALWVPFTTLEGDPSIGARFLIGLGVLVIPLLVFIGLPLTISYSVRRHYQAAPELREPITYVFSHSDIQAVGNTFSATTAWSNFVSAERAGSFYFLGTAQRLFYIVPFEAFQSEEDRKAFCKLVATNVPKCKWRELMGHE
jgi:hypothetical protein